AEDDADGQEHEQDPTAHAHPGQADPDDTQEVVAEQGEDQQEPRADEGGAGGHATLLRRRGVLAQDGEERGALDRVHRHEERGEGGEDVGQHDGDTLPNPRAAVKRGLRSAEPPRWWATGRASRLARLGLRPLTPAGPVTIIPVPCGWVSTPRSPGSPCRRWWSWAPWRRGSGRTTPGRPGRAGRTVARRGRPPRRGPAGSGSAPRSPPSRAAPPPSRP